MSVGEQFQLTATVKPDTAADKSVKWSSSSSSYARVDQSGKVVAKSGGIVYIAATAMDGSNVSASCEVIINYPRTGWIANIDYTATVNVRKTPSPRGEVSTTAGYGRVLTVTAPAMDGWYPVLLSDGTRGYISSQFVVWEKPYDPPKMTTTTKKYIHISKSGYPRNGWAGNQLAQTSKLNLKSQPKSSSSTLRKAPYGTKGVVKGYTSNGYYVGGGGGYQITYAYGNHVQFRKPGINYSALSASDREIVKKSNSGNCGSCGGTGGGTDSNVGGSESIPNGVYIETQQTNNPPPVEEAPTNSEPVDAPKIELLSIPSNTVQAWVYKESGKVIDLFKDCDRKDKIIDYGLPSGTAVYVYTDESDPPIPIQFGSSYALYWGNGEKAYVNQEYVFFELPQITSYIDPEFPVTYLSKKGSVDCFLEVAKSQKDYKAGSDNNTIYTQWFMKPAGTDWCHMFVSWCADQAGILNTHVPYTPTCSGIPSSGIEQFKHKTINGHSAYHEIAELRNGSDSYHVKRGDLVYFLWDGSYKGKTDRANHVGIVIEIDLELNKLITVEGNVKGSVVYGKSREDALNKNQVVGFGEI